MDGSFIQLNVSLCIPWLCITFHYAKPNHRTNLHVHLQTASCYAQPLIIHGDSGPPRAMLNDRFDCICFRLLLMCAKLYHPDKQMNAEKPKHWRALTHKILQAINGNKPEQAKGGS